MNRVFIYWDNSNIFIPSKRLAKIHNGTLGADARVRIDFDAIMKLALAGRPLGRAVASGSGPPKSEPLWECLRASGVHFRHFERGDTSGTEQEAPDNYLRLCMLEDGLRYRNDPGTVVLLTGDGSGYLEGTGFHADLEYLHELGWRIELLSWEDSCSRLMRAWVEENGVFIKLDDFYESITFLEPSRPGHEFAPRRRSAPLDLLRRPRV